MLQTLLLFIRCLLTLKDHYYANYLTAAWVSSFDPYISPGQTFRLSFLSWNLVNIYTSLRHRQTKPPVYGLYPGFCDTSGCNAGYIYTGKYRKGCTVFLLSLTFQHNWSRHKVVLHICRLRTIPFEFLFLQNSSWVLAMRWHVKKAIYVTCLEHMNKFLYLCQSFTNVSHHGDTKFYWKLLVKDIFPQYIYTWSHVCCPVLCSSSA